MGVVCYFHTRRAIVRLSHASDVTPTPPPTPPQNLFLVFSRFPWLDFLALVFSVPVFAIFPPFLLGVQFALFWSSYSSLYGENHPPRSILPFFPFPFGLFLLQGSFLSFKVRTVCGTIPANFFLFLGIRFSGESCQFSPRSFPFLVFFFFLGPPCQFLVQFFLD